MKLVIAKINAINTSLESRKAEQLLFICSLLYIFYSKIARHFVSIRKGETYRV